MNEKLIFYHAAGKINFLLHFFVIGQKKKLKEKLHFTYTGK